MNDDRIEMNQAEKFRTMFKSCLDKLPDNILTNESDPDVIKMVSSLMKIQSKAGKNVEKTYSWFRSRGWKVKRVRIKKSTKKTQQTTNQFSDMPPLEDHNQSIKKETL